MAAWSGEFPRHCGRSAGNGICNRRF